MEPSATTDRPMDGCMECKTQRPYTIEHFPHGNTGWRCVVCGKILRLIPGKSRTDEGSGAGEVPA